ncbi:hypothetical protein QNA08_07930 [Chelatococcus sp. SYSU_G07232]|uniref:DUF1488 domain-containing protein n=1 Tax=Chelatococcus albus TaxID=3047466 RepID=A0ABT7AFK3_9HYPH|nr:hypothetical protein [Chelatococcus sp. SYSU_G07232]MDJ1158159.1 hypothetical protein [Chelatococcus sp. SYSU_G07232]
MTTSYSSDAYVIEVAGRTAGIVARGERGFHFFAASRTFDALDGRVFRRPNDAERAVARHLAGRKVHQAAVHA